MKIVTVTRFDDTDHDAGYDYRGLNYVIQKEEDVFLIRTYDDEPGKASVIRPTNMSANARLRELVEFLQSELKVAGISLYKGELGTYAEIDLRSLAFRPV
jgi:hypothetical protein